MTNNFVQKSDSSNAFKIHGIRIGIEQRLFYRIFVLFFSIAFSAVRVIRASQSLYVVRFYLAAYNKSVARKIIEKPLVAYSYVSKISIEFFDQFLLPPKVSPDRKIKWIFRLFIEEFAS